MEPRHRTKADVRRLACPAHGAQGGAWGLEAGGLGNLAGTLSTALQGIEGWLGRLTAVSRIVRQQRPPCRGRLQNGMDGLEMTIGRPVAVPGTLNTVQDCWRQHIPQQQTHGPYGFSQPFLLLIGHGAAPAALLRVPPLEACIFRDFDGSCGPCRRTCVPSAPLWRAAVPAPQPPSCFASHCCKDAILQVFQTRMVDEATAGQGSFSSNQVSTRPRTWLEAVAPSSRASRPARDDPDQIEDAALGTALPGPGGDPEPVQFAVPQTLWVWGNSLSAVRQCRPPWRTRVRGGPSPPLSRSDPGAGA